MSLSVSSPLRWALTGYGTGEPFVPLRLKPASLGFDRVWDGTAFLISRSCRQRPHWGAADALSFWGASFSPAVILGSVFFPPLSFWGASLPPAVILRSVFFPPLSFWGASFSPAVILGSVFFPPLSF